MNEKRKGPKARGGPVKCSKRIFVRTNEWEERKNGNGGPIKIIKTEGMHTDRCDANLPRYQSKFFFQFSLTDFGK